MSGQPRVLHHIHTTSEAQRRSIRSNSEHCEGPTDLRFREKSRWRDVPTMISQTF
ncbi:MAG: hypothetical protein LC777_21500 [Actinobacteria bacterium]|nr:hypothetical protein [Actinomycetota bacterium]